MVYVEREIPVSARPLRHYQRVFPRKFSPDYKGTGLILGPGLSSTSLHPQYISLDLSFSNVNEMVNTFLRSDVNKDSYTFILPMLRYLTQLKSAQRRYVRSQETAARPKYKIIAGKISLDLSFPFARNAFDDIVSSNCIFGGMDLMHSPEYLSNLITQIMEYVKPYGSLHLFPYFFVEPGSIGFSQYEPLHRDYMRAFETQNTVLDSLRARNLIVTSRITSTDRNRLPCQIKTVTIYKK